MGQNNENDNHQNQEEQQENVDPIAPGSKKQAPGKRSLPARILIKLLKIMLLWIPASVISIIILVLLGLKIYLTPDRVENLIITNFNEMSYGDISLKVRKFSPYGGFEIDDILIKNGKEFDRTKFVEIEKVVLRYGLFSMFIGDIRFDQIGIYKPRIFLKEKNGIWNIARLMRPGEKKPPVEEEKIEELKDEGPPSKEINLPVSIEFLLKFILQDLRLYVESSEFKSSIEGLTFDVDLSIPPFKQIPESVEAVSLLDKMRLQLNPEGKMDVSFFSKDADFDHSLILSWELLFGKGEKGSVTFSSSFKCGTYKAPVRYKKSHLAPLNFIFTYDLFYNPISDYLNLNHLEIGFKDKKWIRLAGIVKNVTKNQQIDIKMAESNIVLDDLYPYFVSLTGDRKTKFHGAVSLFPLTIRGSPSNMDIAGEINLKNIKFRNPSVEATIPNIALSYSIAKRADDMKILAGLKIPHLSYALNRESSGDNNLELGMKISSFNNFRRVLINKFFFKFYNPELDENALYMALRGDVSLQPDISGGVEITRFTFLLEPLLDMLPESLAKSLNSVPLVEPVDMNMNVDFSLGSNATSADLKMLLKVPDFDVNDLRLGVDVIQYNKEKRIVLNSFAMGSKALGLSINAGGMVELWKSPFSDSDLKLVVMLDSPETKTVESWELSGLFKLAAAMKGDLKTGSTSGAIQIDKFFVKNEEAMIAVDDLNLNFPFEYSFKPLDRGGSMILVDKSEIIENENFRDRDNFSIKLIKAKHPARDFALEYLKDFAASISFKNNVFRIANLRAYVFDGSLYARTLMVNLADMDLMNPDMDKLMDKIEYKLMLDITNVDIAKIDAPDQKEKNRDAEISLNANFSGRGANPAKKLDARGYVNIYKIGEKYADKLMQALNEKKGESKLGIAQPVVDNFQKPKIFKFNIEKGNVYSTIKLERKLLSFIATVEKNEVKYDRIPIQEFLRNLFKKEAM